MANAIESLFVELGLDSTEFDAGLDRASQALAQVGKDLEGAGSTVDKVADTFEKGGEAIESAAADASKAVKNIGTTSQGITGVVGRAMDDLQQSVGDAAKMFGMLFGPIVAAFAGGQILSNLSQMGEELSILSDRTGVSVEKIDAWAKANRDAGGSADAFKGALESWTVEQGRSADEFFRLGESVKGMNDTQASYFLQSMGLSQEAAAVFTKFKDTADEAAASYAGVAMTKEQAERAREMNILWRRFTDQVQALGNMLAVTVLPIINAVLDALGEGMAFLNRHSRAVKMVLAAIAALVGGAYLKSILGAVGGFSQLFATLKSGGGIVALVAKGFTALKAAILANPLVAVIAAVTALVAIFEDLFAFLKGEGSAFAGLLHWLGLTDKQILAVRNGILDFFDFLGGIPDKVVAVFETAGEIVTRFGRGISRLWESFDMGRAVEAVKEGFAAIGEFFANLGKKVGDALSSVLASVVSFGQSVKDAIVTGVSDALAWMREAFLAFFGKVGEWVSSALDVGGKIKEKVGSAVDSVASFFGFGGDEPEQKVSEAPQSSAPAAKGKKPYRYFDYVRGKFVGQDGQLYSADEIHGTSQVPRSEVELPPGLQAIFGNATSGPAAAGVITTQSASKGSKGVENNMQITVENNIQTSADPQAVGEAVGKSMDSAFAKRNRMLVNAQTGVVQKG